MQSKCDAQLLREYAEHGHEAAFTEIVTRHTNIVYSAALRQVDLPEIAAEITQNVFLGLARGARTLSLRLAEDASLAGWLCRSARNISLNFRRNEFRQHSRERQAMEQLNPISETAPDWEHLRPVLDEAMSELSESDYDALVMRFFNNQDLRSVGRALGVSDDTAQKRVSRALDKLREHLSRRGISSAASALSIVLSVKAVQAAPAGLAASITVAALSGTAITTTSAIAATKAVAMTALQKALLSTIVVASVVAPLVIQHQAQARLHDQEEAARQQTAQLAKLRQENDGLSNRLAQTIASAALSQDQRNELLKLRSEVGLLRKQAQELAQSKAGNSTSGKVLLASTEKLWATRVDQLKEWLEDNPSEKIVELQFLTDHDWVNSIYPHTFEAPEDYRQAMSTVRAIAESRIMNKLHAAFQQYARASNGQLPTDLSQLKSYLDSPIADAILQRYEIVAATNLVRELQTHGDWVITQKAPVNEALDVRQALGLDTGAMADCRVTNRWTSAH